LRIEVLIAINEHALVLSRTLGCDAEGRQMS
jgi:hypothetical protein